MKQLVFSDPRVPAFIMTRCKTVLDCPATIGIEEDGEIIGGFAATEMQPGIDAMCHIAGLPGRYWGTRRFFQVCFRYLFVQLGLKRVTGLVEADNHAAIELDTRLGFVEEGRLRKRAKDGGDMIVFGMLREECRWIEGEI